MYSFLCVYTFCLSIPFICWWTVGWLDLLAVVIMLLYRYLLESLFSVLLGTKEWTCWVISQFCLSLWGIAKMFSTVAAFFCFPKRGFQFLHNLTKMSSMFLKEYFSRWYDTQQLSAFGIRTGCQDGLCDPPRYLLQVVAAPGASQTTHLKAPTGGWSSLTTREKVITSSWFPIGI